VRIGPDAARLFVGGSALIVGAVEPDGSPYAIRAWGALVADDGAALRFYVDADDARARSLLTPGATVAVTGGDVKTLASAQVKGPVRVLDDLTALDIATRERATALFVEEVHETDHTPRDLLERMVPARFLACTLDVAEVYDQTPGPHAGATFAESS
jgi:hypothetical protein